MPSSSLTDGSCFDTVGDDDPRSTKKLGRSTAPILWMQIVRRSKNVSTWSSMLLSPKVTVTLYRNVDTLIIALCPETCKGLSHQSRFRTFRGVSDNGEGQSCPRPSMVISHLMSLLDPHSTLRTPHNVFSQKNHRATNEATELPAPLAQREPQPPLASLLIDPAVAGVMPSLLSQKIIALATMTLTVCSIYDSVSTIHASVRSVSTDVPLPSQPLLHTVAPTYFPIHSKSGLIDFSPQVKTVIIDVGARESDYLTLLERNPNDHSMAVILVDPLRDSMLPLQQRAGKFSSRGKERWMLPAMQRVFTLPAALGLHEGTMDFNVSPGPSCGSLLRTAKSNSFWCAETSRRQRVLVYTLKDLLDLIPPSIQDIHVKVDAEGADLLVLQGAGDAVQRVSTVIIECQDLPAGDPGLFREGSCRYEEAKAYMCQNQKFCDVEWVDQGHQGNALFRQSKQVSVPDAFVNHRSPLQFKSLYEKSQL